MYNYCKVGAMATDALAGANTVLGPLTFFKNFQNSSLDHFFTIFYSIVKYRLSSFMAFQQRRS